MYSYYLVYFHIFRMKNELRTNHTIVLSVRVLPHNGMASIICSRVRADYKFAQIRSLFRAQLVLPSLLSPSSLLQQFSVKLTTPNFLYGHISQRKQQPEDLFLTLLKE